MKPLRSRWAPCVISFVCLSFAVAKRGHGNSLRVADLQPSSLSAGLAVTTKHDDVVDGHIADGEARPLRQAGDHESQSQDEKHQSEEKDDWHSNHPFQIKYPFSIVFVVVFVLFFWWLGRLFLRNYSQYHAFKEAHGTDFQRSFGDYLRYRLGYWFVWTDAADAKIVLCLMFIFVFLGTVCYTTLAHSRVSHSVYQVFVWLVAPDGGAFEESKGGKAVGMTVSFGGLLAFALLMTLVQNLFDQYLVVLRTGLSPVIETGHTLIVGFTQDTLPLVMELCHASKDKPITIVILALQDKTVVDDKIRAENIDLKGTSIVVRSGHPHRVEDLKHVSTEFAETILLLPDRAIDKELRDAFIMQALVSIRGSGWPLAGRIVAVCSLMRNASLFRKLGGEHTEVVMLDVWLAKTFVYCGHHNHLGAVLSSLFSFKGSSFHSAEVPDWLHGRTFGEASHSYPSCVLVGVLREGEPENIEAKLCPGAEYQLDPKDTLMLLAEDVKSIEALKIPMSSPMPLCRHPDFTLKTLRPKPVKETILMLGWNDNSGLMLLEIESEVAPGTQVLILSRRPTKEREEFIKKVQARWESKLENISSIVHVEGSLGSRHELDELPIKIPSATRILIFAEEGAWPTSAQSDACTVAVTLQVREIIAEHQGAERIAIVSEITDPACEKHCDRLGLTDFVNSSLLPAQLLTMISQRPRLREGLYDLISDDGTVLVAIRSISDYFPAGDTAPTEFNFWQASRLCARSGDVLIGWLDKTQSEERDEDEKSAEQSRDFRASMAKYFTVTGDAHRACEWMINPKDKHKLREWNAKEDKLIVISPKACSQTSPLSRAFEPPSSASFTPREPRF